MAFLTALGGLAGLAGGLISDSSTSSAEKTAANAAQTDANAQSALDSQLQSQYAQLEQDYDSYYQPLLDPLSTTIGQVYNESEPQQTSTFADAEQDLNNPSTTLSGTSGTGGYTMQQLYDQSVNGLDPAYSGYMLGQVQNAGEQATNNVVSQLGSAIPNASGLAGDIAMNTLQETSQTAEQLASQNQQVKDNALAALQSEAGGIDTMNAQNLEAAYGLANGQTSALESYINQGDSTLNQGTQGTSSIAGQYAAAGSQAAGTAAADTATLAANNPFSSLSSILANGTKATTPVAQTTATNSGLSGAALPSMSSGTLQYTNPYG